MISNRERVKHIRVKNPCLSLQSIGDICGISRERARQILDRAGLPTRAIHPGTHLCLNCRRTLPKQHKLFCNLKCMYEYSHSLTECEQCHKLFRKRYSLILNTNHDFCSRKCLGRWLGLHNIGTHPTRKPHNDYDLIERLFLQGFSYQQLHRYTGHSLEYLYLIVSYRRKERDIPKRVAHGGGRPPGKKLLTS